MPSTTTATSRITHNEELWTLVKTFLCINVGMRYVFVLNLSISVLTWIDSHLSKGLYLKFYRYVTNHVSRYVSLYRMIYMICIVYHINLYTALLATHTLFNTITNLFFISYSTYKGNSMGHEQNTVVCSISDTSLLL